MGEPTGGLIPAWAGNTVPLFPCYLIPWAHPRVGGEYLWGRL